MREFWHIEPGRRNREIVVVAVHERMAANDHQGARAIWSRLEPLVPLLFREANPMPIKRQYATPDVSTSSTITRLPSLITAM
jgi:dihydrodipicolinate synthase/N-acetylneuraminate lyase